MNSHWILSKIPPSRSRFANFFVATMCLGFIYLVVPVIAGQRPQQSPNSVFLDAAAPVYAPDPSDSWNRIFFYLFSRRIETRVTDEFPEFRGATAFHSSRKSDGRHASFVHRYQ